MTSLQWLPVCADFGERVRAAMALVPAERLASLHALSQYRLDYVQTTQLERVLRTVPDSEAAALTRVKLAILASSTVEHLTPAIRVAGLRRDLWLDVYLAPYGQYRQELLAPDSGVRRFKPDVVLFALSAREFIAEIPIVASADDASAQLTAAAEGLAALWDRARTDLGATVVQQTFLNHEEPVFGSYDRAVAAAPAELIRRLNDRVAGAAERHGVALVDAARASEREGLDVWFDRSRYLQAKMEVAPQAAASYGELVARVVAAQRGLSKKCLVLDLDNTLWGGLIGDDGVEGIVLGEGSAAGEAHLALQRYARQLRDRGVILAVCSKNDPAIAEAAIRDHPEMLLKRTDFAAFVANWGDKAANLRAIAEELNIGIDSLVFVDDNPAERARIRESLPMVAVPELPENAADYVSCVAAAGYFEAVAFTSEDRARGDQYVAGVARDALQKASQSMEEFLGGLQMKVAYGHFRAVDLPRVTQLINKTNQFNLTTQRYSTDEVAEVHERQRCLTLQFRLVDRFGDNGLVSVMILRRDASREDVLDIDTWVMSCRVFGRQLEHEAMNIAVEIARANGGRLLRGTYIPTRKNGVVRDLYAQLGFVADAAADAAEGTTRWTLDASAYAPHTTFISRSAESND